MLAYVFWHWPRAEADPAEYELAQRAFHAELAASLPPGFLGSSCHRLHGAPWTAAGGVAYEDWYLQENSAALDDLNTAAVTAGRKAVHDRAAALAAGGTAGLYQLMAGGHLPAAVVSQWFSKPEGWSYARLVETLEPLISEAGAALWMRRMVLGPTPEFCLRTATPMRLSAPIEADAYSLTQVWPA